MNERRPGSSQQSAGPTLVAAVSFALIGAQAYAGCSSDSSGAGGSSGTTSGATTSSSTGGAGGSTTSSTSSTGGGTGPAFENPTVCGETTGCPAPIPNTAGSKTRSANLHAKGGTLELDVPGPPGTPALHAKFNTSTYNGLLPGPTIEMTTTASDPASPKESDFLLLDVFNDGKLDVCCGQSTDPFCTGVSLPMNQCQRVDGDTNMHTHGLHIASATAAFGAADACQFKTTDPASPDLPWDDIFIPIPASAAAQEEVMSCTPDKGCTTAANDQHFVYPLPPHSSPSAFQPAAVTYPQWFGLEWYHPHMHETSNDQFGRGLAGALIIRNPAEQSIPVLAALGKDAEKVLVLQRLTTDADSPPPSITARLVNGVQNPEMTIKPGETQRWRVLNATANNAVQLSLPGQKPGQQALTYAPIGFDGVPTPDIRPALESYYVLPGSRLEMLVTAPAGAKEGDTYELTWCEPMFDPFFNLVDKLVPDGKCTGTRVVAATLRVTGAAATPVTYAAGDTFANLPSFGLADDLWSGVVPDVKRTIKFSQDVNGFYLDTGDGKGAEMFTMDQMCMPRVSSTLGAVEEWTLENWTGDLHTFHLHVNPFQVDPADVDPKLGSKPFYQDNIFVPPGTIPPIPDGGLPDGGNPNQAISPGKVKIRIRIRDYIGTAVFHCHLLFHEDHGMMAAVTVSPP
ncbi:MAG: multicopper oxidase domain-containing protein [Byssovorax sp.]